MPTMLCSYNGKIMKMTDDQVKKSLIETEKKLRTPNNFQYTKLPTQPKVDNLKKTWTKEAQEFVRASAKALANGGNVSEEIVHKSLLDTCKNYVAPLRAKKNRTEAATEFIYMAGEIALATLFNIAPDTNPEFVSKAYGIGTKTIKVKSSANPKRLVIDEDKVNDAEIYVQALLMKDLEMAILIGWATKADILSAKKGNKDTDPDCNWVRTAYHIPLERLRPMSELMKEHGLKEIPNEVVFETIPNLAEIPIMTSPESQLMLITAPPKKEESFDDFLKSCGIAEEPKGLQL